MDVGVRFWKQLYSNANCLAVQNFTLCSQCQLGSCLVQFLKIYEFVVYFLDFEIFLPLQPETIAGTKGTQTEFYIK